ncbi:PTS sugar transporter subunit IIB, partial [Enterococcus faecalis]|nr:PTS sugar transporter subunit IIB [Enterococcus faecalis]
MFYTRDRKCYLILKIQGVFDMAKKTIMLVCSAG